MSGLGDLGLSPQWDDLKLGDQTDIQAYLIIWDPTGVKHLCKCVVTGQFFVASGKLSNLPCYTFLQCHVMGTHPRVHVNVAMGFPLGHGVPTEGIYSQCVEACAGAGFMGEGIKACGISIEAVI